MGRSGSIPTTFVINKDMKLVKMYIGQVQGDFENDIKSSLNRKEKVSEEKIEKALNKIRVAYSRTAEISSWSV